MILCIIFELKSVLLDIKFLECYFLFLRISYLFHYSFPTMECSSEVQHQAAFPFEFLTFFV